MTAIPTVLVKEVDRNIVLALEELAAASKCKLYKFPLEPPRSFGCSCPKRNWTF